MRKYRFGIIGLGMIAEFHIQAIRAMPNAELVSVCSRREAKVTAAAEKYSCQGTTNYEELLTDPKIDIICVTTSSGSHAEIGQQVLLAGKHLLIEKPMAMSSADAARLTHLARERKLHLGVVSQRRFEPQHQAVQRIVTSGALGRLLLAELRCPFYRTQEYYDSAEWRGTLTEDGGALMNQGIHSIDLLLWLAGRAHSVMGMTATQVHKMESEDLGLALVRFKSGALGTVMSTTNVQPGYPPSLRLYGEKGSIHLEGTAITVWDVPNIPMPAEVTVGTSSGAGVSDPSHIPSEYHQLQLEQFLTSLDEGSEPAVTGEDGHRAIELIEAICLSSAEGREIQLSGTP